jgi:hypothetical protein
MNLKNREGTQFKKGESGNPEGRPRKYVSLLKEQGYKLSEVNDAIQVLISMNEDELHEVLDNENATILEMTIAKAMINSLSSGSLNSVETLLNRVYGKPKETVDQNINGDFNITLNLG